MTDQIQIADGEAYAWAVPVLGPGGSPLDISDGVVAASAQRLTAPAAVVEATAALGDAYTIHGDFAPGVLGVGLWRVQTWLTRSGEPQRVDEFIVDVSPANG